MTWPSHAPAVLFVLQGKAGQGAGQGPSVRLFVLQGRGQGRVRLSVCLSCRAGGKAGRAGQGPNKE